MEPSPGRATLLRPALFAAALSPVVAELLTATTPPRAFADPLPALCRFLLYGCGVLVVHELAIGWRRGWPAVMFLGLAFGTVVEGLVSRSLFTTEWLLIGLLGDYGHWLGINWHFTLLMLVFHAVYSIALPLLLAELVWPASRGRTWLDPAATQMLLTGFIAAALYDRRNAMPAAPRSAWIALGMLAILVYLARHARGPRRPPRRMHPPWLLACAAAGWVVLWLLAQVLLPELELAKFHAWLLLLGLIVLASWRWAVSAAGWTDRHQLAVVAGLLLPWVLLSPALAADAGRVDDASGMQLVGALAVAGWLLLWRRVRGHAAVGCYNGGGGTDAVGSTG